MSDPLVPGSIRLIVNGVPVRVRGGATVAAAILGSGAVAFRHSVTGEPRAPFCGMGVCFECRVTLDGEPHRLACQILAHEGMVVKTP